MRLKAVIVDDEPGVCDLLCALGMWDALSIEIISVCYDGDEALDAILKHCPDIVLCDIRMPGMDGLELIERTAQAGIHTRFVILSGYSLFEYAQRAMLYGVNHYLLKPVDAEQLNQVLSQIRDEIVHEASIQKRQAEAILQDQISLKRAWINDVFSERRCFSMQEADRLFHIHFAQGEYFIFAVCTDRPDLHNENSAFYHKMSFGITHQMNELGESELIAHEDGLYDILCVRDEAITERDVDAALRTLHKEIGAMTDIFGPFRYTFARSCRIRSVDEIPAELRLLRKQFQCRIFFGDADILTGESCSRALAHSKEKMPAISGSELAAAIETCQMDKVESWLSQAASKLKQDSPGRIDAICEINTQIEQACMRLYTAAAADPDMREPIQAYREMTKYVCGISNYIQAIYTFLYDWLSAYKDSVKKQELRPIRLAKDYIEEHLGEPISLEDVAEYVNYSSSYLSTLFHRETEMNFSNYLQKLRIERAKDYLKNSSLSIVEIAERLGFTSDKYFRKVFKKEIGIRAKEYRDLYR